MKKNYTIIGIAGVVLLAVGFMYFVFGGAPRGIQKVISNDGLAELAIPKNALPEGMSIKDISITNVSVNDDIIAYEFKPDGTAFPAGLTFKATFKNEGNVIPIPFFISEENGIELVSGAEVSLNLTKNEATISVPITHFSVVIFSIDANRVFFDATMKVPAEVYIGDVVYAQATLNKNIDSVVLFSQFNPWAVPLLHEDKDPNNPILGPHNLGYRIARDSVRVSGEVTTEDYLLSGNAVGPYMTFYGYPKSSLFTGESLSVKSNDFRCDKLGFGVLGFRFDFEYVAEAVDVITKPVPGDSEHIFLEAESYSGLRKFDKSGQGSVEVSAGLRCVARPTVESGTGSGVSESESKAVGDILDEAPPATKPPGKGIVCGLPGGPACPPKK